MHSQTLILNSITSTSKDKLDLDHENVEKNPQDFLHTEPDPVLTMDNNPPDSFWVSETKVNDWLDRHTFMERKASVKLATGSRNFDQTPNRTSHRSVSFSYKPKPSIIGFGRKPNNQADGKCKQNDKPDKVRLFRNRSEPGREYYLQVTEPVSPRVSCIGRIGSKRGRDRKTGIWKSFKGAFSNRVQKSTVPKKVR